MMKHLILYLSAIAVSCTCVAADISTASKDDDLENAALRLLASRRIPTFKKKKTRGPASPSKPNRARGDRLPDSAYDHPFFDELHKQLKARDFSFFPTDRTRRNKLLAMFTAYHELPDPEQHTIVKALEAAGILKARLRLRTTPEELRERQERKKETNAAYEQRKAARSATRTKPSS